jgi:hypothetical protein
MRPTSDTCLTAPLRCSRGTSARAAVGLVHSLAPHHIAGTTCQAGVPRHKTRSSNCSGPLGPRAVNQLAMTTGEITLVGLDQDPVAFACSEDDAATRTTAVTVTMTALPRQRAVVRSRSLDGMCTTAALTILTRSA